MSTSDNNSLLAVERQRVILEMLRREGVVRTAELHELLNVSLVTIRSDLRELERIGECEVIWGGAVSSTPPTEAETELEQRSKLNSDRKKRIGQRAADLVETGQTIIVDAGSTTVELVHHLPRNLDYLRVVTPALNIAVAATHHPDVELVMPGGVLRSLTHSLIGSQTLRALEMHNADWTFLASGGFSAERGVTTSNMLEVEVKKTMVHQAQQVVLLADSSKFGRVRSLTVAPIKDIDIIITDTKLPDDDTTRLEALGVRVFRV